MEPLSVTCPSCQGKLVVKNEKLLGRVVPCPRCQSPVAIPSLQKYKFSPPNGAADSHAITKVADDQWMTDIDSALEAHRREKETSPSSAEETPRFREEEEDFKLAPVESPENPEVASVLAQAAASFEPFSPNSKIAVHPNTHKSRQLLLIAMLGIGGLCVSIGLFYLFLQYVRGGPQKDLLNNSSVAQNPSTNAEEIGLPIREDSNEKEMVQPDTALETGAQETNGANPIETPVDNDENVGPPQDVETTQGDLNPDETNADESVSASPSADTSTSVGDPNTSGPLSEEMKAKMEAMQGAVTSLKDSRSAALASSGATPAASSVDQSDIPDEMKRFLKGGILGGPLLSDAALQTDEVDVPTLPEVIEVGELIHPGMAAAPKSGSLDMRLQKLKVVDRSLFDLLHWLSSLSSVGISVDYQSMVAAAIERDQTLRIEFGEEQSLKQILEGLASSMDMQVDVLEGDLIMLRATDDAISKALPGDWSFADLATPDTLDVWGRFLADVMPDEASLWTIENGGILWQPTATPLQKFRAAIELDRMRVACQLPPKGGYLPKDLAVGLGFESTVARFQSKGTRVIIQEQPIVQTLQQIANEAQFKLIADWPNLWRHGFTPTMSRLTIQRNRTVEQVFGYFLDRYAMELTIADPSILRLTIPEVRRLDHQLRVVPLTATQSVDVWRERLRALSPTDENRVSRFLVVPIPGRSLAVVRICAPTISQAMAIMGEKGN